MGAGPPTISPGVSLPGGEYFALAPNRSIALGPRLATNVNSGTVTIPASGTNNQIPVSILLEPSWTSGEGLFLVRSYGLFVSGDGTGKIQINNVRMGIGIAPLNIFLDMGLPTATLSSPTNAIITIYERDALVTWLDFPTSAGNLIGQPASMIYILGVTNTDAASHTLSWGGTCVWHRLNGFVQ